MFCACSVGKHGTEYARVIANLYPTPRWVIAALAEYVELRGLAVWEPACGDCRMVEALRLAGCCRVYATDIIDRGNGQDARHPLTPPASAARPAVGLASATAALQVEIDDAVVDWLVACRWLSPRETYGSARAGGGGFANRTHNRSLGWDRKGYAQAAFFLICSKGARYRISST